MAFRRSDICSSLDLIFGKRGGVISPLGDLLRADMLGLASSFGLIERRNADPPVIVTREVTPSDLSRTLEPARAMLTTRGRAVSCVQGGGYIRGSVNGGNGSVQIEERYIRVLALQSVREV